MIRTHAFAVAGRSWRSATVTSALLLALAACDLPNFDGPQIQSPPPAFFLQREAFQQQRMFPYRDIAYHDAWVETSDGRFSAIYINGHAGVLTEDDVYAAQDSAKKWAQTPITFDPIERLTIDGREAWGWAERLQTPALGIAWVAFRAIVPYDTITYVIEMHGGEPGLKSKPDSLRVIVSSFAVGETAWDFPLIAIMAGALLILINLLRNRAAERAVRLQGISLRQISKEELERAKARAAAAGAGAPSAPEEPGGSGVPPNPAEAPGGTTSNPAPVSPAPAPKTPTSIADAVRQATMKPPTDPSGSA